MIKFLWKFRWFHQWMGHRINGPTFGSGFLYYKCDCGGGWVE